MVALIYSCNLLAAPWLFIVRNAFSYLHWKYKLYQRVNGLGMHLFLKVWVHPCIIIRGLFLPGFIRISVSSAMLKIIGEKHSYWTTRLLIHIVPRCLYVVNYGVRLDTFIPRNLKNWCNTKQVRVFHIKRKVE